MIAPLVASVLAGALAGSPHCAGMCGGFVCFYAGADAPRAPSWRAHAAYNGGRLLSYATLGTVAALIGARLDRLGALAGVSRAAALVAGALMILWGGVSLARVAGVRWFAGDARAASTGGAILARALRAVRARSAVARAFAMGLLTTLLPCGFLYAFVAIAAGTADVLSGALVMAAFWLGTVPVMWGLGTVAQRVLVPLRRRAPLATAGVLIAFGLLTMAGKFHPTACEHCATHEPVTR